MIRALVVLSLVLASCQPSVKSPKSPQLEKVRDFQDVTPRPGSYGMSHRDSMKALRRRTVRIEYTCEFSELDLMGSGVVIGRDKGDTLIATADHVVEAILEDECEIIVKDFRGMSDFAEVVGRDEDDDVAILKVGERLGEAAALYDDPYLGMPITCIGWPMLPHKDVKRRSVTTGSVSTLDVEGYMRISADLYFGNSGGPCFSESGKVVGIVSHFMVGGRWMGLPTPRPGQFYISEADNLKKLLD